MAEKGLAASSANVRLMELTPFARHYAKLWAWSVLGLTAVACVAAWRLQRVQAVPALLALGGATVLITDSLELLLGAIGLTSLARTLATHRALNTTIRTLLIALASAAGAACAVSVVLTNADNRSAARLIFLTAVGLAWAAGLFQAAIAGGSYVNEAGNAPLPERVRQLGALALYGGLVWEAVVQLG
jgi:hypothetical protein